MILSAQTIERFCQPSGGLRKALVSPFNYKQVVRGRSYGLSHSGYDVRVDQFKVNGENSYKCRMEPGDFYLASSIERIVMPPDLICFVKDKSSWAREGLCVQNTVLEPGWEGYITFELSFHRKNHHVSIESGDPIAQLIFQRLDEPTHYPYSGKYQNQEAKPVEAIHEESKSK